MNIYQTFYDLLQSYVFGGEILANSPQELIAVLCSTIATLFLISLPFLVVWRVIRLIANI